MYDGLKEIDDYDQWFAEQLPEADPLATGLGWNDHGGRVYVYPKYYHPRHGWGAKQSSLLSRATTVSHSF